MTPSSAPSPAASVRRRRLSPDARREQILLAAERLFAERSFADVSTTELAREAGVARGLLNHYFGDKRALYLEVVRRAALLPTLEDVPLPTGSIDERVDEAVRWFLSSYTPERASYITVRAAEGVGEDAEVVAILDAGADLAAGRVLEMVGGDPSDPASRAVLRSFGELARGAIREWARDEALSREQAHLLLSQALLTIVRSVLPQL